MIHWATSTGGLTIRDSSSRTVASIIVTRRGTLEIISNIIKKRLKLKISKRHFRKRKYKKHLTAIENVPRGHVEHCPDPFAKVPEGHEFAVKGQVDEPVPAIENVFEAHCLHVEIPIVLDTPLNVDEVPAGHKAHPVIVLEA